MDRIKEKEGRKRRTRITVVFEDQPPNASGSNWTVPIKSRTSQADSMPAPGFGLLKAVQILGPEPHLLIFNPFAA